MYRHYYFSIAVCLFHLFNNLIDVDCQRFKPYVGLHGGINFSQTLIIQNYDIVTMIDGENDTERVYDPLFSNFGHQVGFSFFLSLNDYLALGLCPELAYYSYGYTSAIEFYDDQGIPASQVENISNQRITYFNIPLLIQYTIRKADNSPFLLGGASYGILRSAQHYVDSHNTLYTPSGDLEFNTTTIDNYTTEFIRSKLNIFAGVGYFYDLTLFRVSVDVCYWFGLHNLLDEANRYQNQSISGSTYDIPDDLTLNHIVTNLSILFPINKPNTKGSLDCVPFKKRK